MDKREFEAWKARTNESANKWIVDDIHNGKDGRDLLAYRGGQDGAYFMVALDGTVIVGTYTGALPHIGEADFTAIGKLKCLDFEDGKSRVLVSLGLKIAA